MITLARYRYTFQTVKNNVNVRRHLQKGFSVQQQQPTPPNGRASSESSTTVSTPQMSSRRKKGLALVMGVANQRSIAWACVESFLRKNYDCIITYHIPQPPPSHYGIDDDVANIIINREKYTSKIEHLASPHMRDRPISSAANNNSDNDDDRPQIIACFPCNVETDIPILCREYLMNVVCNEGRTIDAIVHSVAYASEMERPLLQTTRASYLQAQHISAYSLIEIIRECMNSNLMSKSNSSITTLSYLGAIRVVPGYGSMGPAKAALESIVRTLAYEVNNCTSGSNSITTNACIRVNAVSAGPMKTISARGIPNFHTIQQHVVDHAPLQRNVTVDEVAETITWLSISGTGITGQTIYVDAGYNSIVPL